jgi:hypothetical protein
MEFFYVFLENLHVDRLSRLIRWEGTVIDAEEGHETWVDSVTTGTLWGNATEELCVDNLSQLKVVLGLVVELQSTNEEEAKSQRLLGSIDVDLWHVHIINEDDHSLSGSLGTILLEGLLVDVFHEVVLEISSRGP